MSTTVEAPVYEVGRVYEFAPGDLRIGTNVRKDTLADTKGFAASVRSRGVIVAIDAHVGEQGRLCVLRRQRRALVAAQVGTPSDTVPVRVVPAPGDADRITDQLLENLHRAHMREREARDGIEQIARWRSNLSSRLHLLRTPCGLGLARTSVIRGQRLICG